MATNTAKWGLGATGWEVEWCVDFPRDASDPTMSDPDRARFDHRDFRTRAEADAFAREVFPRDQIGSVSITPFVLIRDLYGLNCAYTDDTDYYEGE